MNETDAIIKETRQTFGKWWIISGILLAFVLVLLAIAIQYVPNYRAIKQIRAMGGYVETEPGFLSSFLPEGLQRAFNESLFGSAVGEITIIVLSGPTVDDKKVATLKKLVNPNGLALISDKLTDDSLIHLKEMSNLHRLRINSLLVTDDGLLHLKSLPNLTEFAIQGTLITDAGLLHLSELVNLKLLSLEKTKVTNDGLAHLNKMTNLEILLLNDSDISDAGLVHLKKMTKLKHLHLNSTRVTAEGIKELKAALPTCEIDWSPAAP